MRTSGTIRISETIKISGPIEPVSKNLGTTFHMSDTLYHAV